MQQEDLQRYKKPEILIKFEGVDRETVLTELGWKVKNGYIYEADGSQVVSRLDGRPLKLKHVKGVFPGSRILISDIFEIEDYLSEEE
ncbi:MAG: hypothetical protein M1351_04710 [Candidatus Thermoplasmatota archaeon]|jgi:hypothetical protein|nr:hypothetical protein [Candidatus Thermoplasmatota archaeon]